MDKTFYGFEGSGFKLTPDRRLRFSHDGYRVAFRILVNAIRQREGFSVLTGAPGTGKTTLSDDLAAELEGDGWIVGKVTSSQVDADDLLRLVGFEFGLQADALSKAKLLTKLKDQLTGKNSSGRSVILLIDEAQDLTVEALDELHLIFDLIAGQGRIVQILLCGQERLWERLRQPACEQIRQLIVKSCRLSPLCPDDTSAYVAHSLGNMGWKGDPEFSADALQLIHASTGGIPRLINLTMGRLLLHGSLGELHALESHDVEIVLEQMGEDHPELLGVTSKPELPPHPAPSQRLPALDARAAAEVEPPKSVGKKALSLSVKDQSRNASAQGPTGWPQSVAGWNRRWVLGGLLAVTISVFMAYVSSWKSDESDVPLARAPDSQKQPRILRELLVDQFASEPAETLPQPAEAPSGPVEVRSEPIQTPLLPVEAEWVPDAHKAAPAEAVSEIVALQLGMGSTENREPDRVAEKSAVAESELRPLSQQGPLVNTAGTAISAQITEAVLSSKTPAEDQEQQSQADNGNGGLLGKAQIAFSRNRLTVPPGDNAYAYYRKVLARDPGNAQALAGVRRIVLRYRQLAKQRLRKGDTRGARTFASRGLKIWPRDRQLLAIKRKAARKRVATRQSEPSEVFERVGKWFRSGGTAHSEFLNQ